MNASITEIISPIKLLVGHRSDTKKTGHGCFMDVISYLNGDAQITDESECVCPVIRTIAIYLNDLLNDEQRYRLLPFVERAMGTSNAPIKTIVARSKIAVKFSTACKNICNNSDISAANSAAIWASNNAEISCHDDFKIFYAIRAARHAVKGASIFFNTSGYVVNMDWALQDYFIKKQKIIEAMIECLEEMCPPSEVNDTTVIQRAYEFTEIYKQTVYLTKA